MLNLDEVHTFKAVATSSSFTDAAEQLHVTQSTVSHQIRRLEERLGQVLFQRTTRSVSLTLAGERFLPYADQLLSMSNAAEQSVSSDNMVGEVRIGVPEEFAYLYLPQLLKRFRLHYPNVALSMEVDVSATLKEKLRSGGLDMALLKSVPATRNCIHHEPLVWMGRPALLKQDTLPVAFYPGPCAFRKAAIQALEKSGIPYSVILISASLEALRIAADAGVVISVVPQRQCPPELLLSHEGSGMPPLPEMGYQLRYEKSAANQPVNIAAALIEELLGQ